MTCKKVCKQYPQDQYKAPDISGKWEIYYSYQGGPDGITTKINFKVDLIFNQENLFFNYQVSYPGGIDNAIGMLYPVGKCWEAKSVDDGDNGTYTLHITEIKNGKATKMISIYTEAGYQKDNPAQVPTVAVGNCYRAD